MLLVLIQPLSLAKVDGYFLAYFSLIIVLHHEVEKQKLDHESLFLFYKSVAMTTIFDKLIV